MKNRSATPQLHTNGAKAANQRHAAPGSKPYRVVLSGYYGFSNTGDDAILDAIIQFLPAPTDIPAIKGVDMDGNEITLNQGKTFVEVVRNQDAGVLRRRPDARWNWSVEKLEALVKLQAEILDQVAPLVPSGGTLVYSTCSNEPEENLDQVNAFLARHPDFTLDTFGVCRPPP